MNDVVGNELRNQLDDDANYFSLDKAIWERFNMIETKSNVIQFMRKYKEARIRSTKLITMIKISSNYDLSGSFSPTMNNKGFSESSDKKIDAERFVNNTLPVINELRKTFTPEENQYYEFCLSANNSEEYFKNSLGISNNGLLPIKNSCLLKIAFAFGLEVSKDDKS